MVNLTVFFAVIPVRIKCLMSPFIFIYIHYIHIKKVAEDVLINTENDDVFLIDHVRSNCTIDFR